MPHPLQTTGIGWLIGFVLAVGLSLVIFTGELRGPAVAVTVVDDAVVRWLAGLDGPGLSATMKVLAVPGSWPAITVLVWGLLLALIVLRRLRHLLVVVAAWTLQGFLVQYVLGPMLRRPRPFGVVFRTDWYAWALPSEPMAALAVTLVGILYALVPEGRWRQRGKWTAVVAVALVAVARMSLGVEAPTDVVVGVVIGVTIALLGFRWFTPNEVFPVTYRRGRAAHLDIGGARGEAIRRALEDQLGLVVEEVEPFGLAGSAGSTPLRIKTANGPSTWLFGKLYARSHLRADRWYKLGRELLYGRLEDEKPFHTVRRLVQQEDYALHKLHLAGLPDAAALRLRRAHPRTGVPAGHRVLRPCDRARRRRHRRAGGRRRPGAGPQAVGQRAGPPRHQTSQPPRPRRPLTADRRGVRAGPSEPVAPSCRPGQHDAVPGVTVRSTNSSTSGHCAGSASPRSAKHSPLLEDSPCPPSYATCCATKAGIFTPNSSTCSPPGPSRSGSNAGAPAASPCWC